MDTFDTLPDEMIEYICSFLNGMEIVNLIHVCSRFEKMIYDWISTNHLHSSNGDPMFLVISQAFSRACSFGNVQQLKIIRQRMGRYHEIRDYSKASEQSSSGLYNACRHGHANVIKYLADVWGYTRSDISQNHYWIACKHGHLSVLQCLWALGSPPDASEIFELACFCGHMDIVTFLGGEKLGINVQIQNALLGACLNRHFEILRYLAQRYGISQEFRINLFRIACGNGFFKIVRFLVEELNLTNEEIDKDDGFIFHLLDNEGVIYIFSSRHPELPSIMIPDTGWKVDNLRSYGLIEVNTLRTWAYDYDDPDITIMDGYYRDMIVRDERKELSKGKAQIKAYLFENFEFDEQAVSLKTLFDSENQE